MAWMVSADHPLSGLCGGDDASPYSSRFEVGSPNEYKVDLSARAQLPAGAVIAYQHGGGAGFGPALERDPEAVKDDVLDEYVSVAAAREKYGVVLTGSLEDYDLAVDVAATAALQTKNESGQGCESSLRSIGVRYRVGIDIGGTFTDFALLKGAKSFCTRT